MIELYIPQLEDLWFRQILMSDEETMSYNNAWGGTIDFPKEDWENWYNCWVLDNNGEFFYRYLKDSNTNNFIGEIAYHIDDEKCMANIIIFAKYRNKGYGKEGLLMLCNAAKKNGYKEIFDDMALDNPAIHLFKKLGFDEEYRTDEIVMLKKDL